MKSLGKGEIEKKGGEAERKKGEKEKKREERERYLATVSLSTEQIKGPRWTLKISLLPCLCVLIMSI